MAKQDIKIGTSANDRTGDPLRTAFQKAKANFDELYDELHFKGKYVSLVALQTAHATAEDGDYAIVDAGEGSEALEYIWDEDEGWVREVSSSSIISALGYTPENQVNKATDFSTVNHTKYPSVQAVNERIAAVLGGAGYLTSSQIDTLAEINAILSDADLASISNSAVALVDASTMDLTATKHTLTSSAATRTFTISYTGDDIVIEVTLNATSATYTFPATSKCISEGVASGNNTLSLSGQSGDIYIIAIKKIGSKYTVVSKNTFR
jgi:hypothetical protein